MDRFELRYNDFSLSEDQDTVFLAFADFFRKECPTTLVRAAEPLGYDSAFWRKLSDMGVTTMSLPASAGGDDASLVDMVIVAEEFGRAVAPAPFISQVVAARLLATVGADALSSVLGAGELVAVALSPTTAGVRQLVPDAAIARHVIALVDGELVLHTTESPSDPVPNQGRTPLGWWSPDSAAERTVLASGTAAAGAFTTAVAEWKLLTSAALIGMTEAALKLGVEFSKTRETMGVPIGTLQGVAFPLVDVEIGLSSGRNLVRRTAWWLDVDPTYQPELASAVLPYCARVATTGTTAAAHVQGGLGFTSEADASLYFLRAKGWSVLGGDPQSDYLAVADALASRVAV